MTLAKIAEVSGHPTSKSPDAALVDIHPPLVFQPAQGDTDPGESLPTVSNTPPSTEGA